MTVELARLQDIIASVPVPCILQEVATGQLYEVFGGVAEAGGYYLIRMIDPPADVPDYLLESRLQPGHVGRTYVVVGREQIGASGP